MSIQTKKVCTCNSARQAAACHDKNRCIRYSPGFAEPPNVKTHNLKTWPEYFEAVECGVKMFEVRRNYRGFHVNDYLRLQEWNPGTKHYTGREITMRIQFILEGGQFGIEQGVVVMGLEKPVLGPFEPDMKY